MSSHPFLDQEVVDGLPLAMEIPMESMKEVSQPGSERPTEIEQLDPKGDLVLAVGDVRLLVSSRVLELSCPFFEKMLQPHRFAEGSEQPSSEHPPTKELQEEHSQTLRLMCQLLHYIPVQPPKSTEALILFANTCDYYGCAPALSFHVQAWLEMLNLITASNSQLQILLRVSFLFNLGIIFKRVSSRLAQTLTPREWKAWEVHPMPGDLKEDIRTSCEVLKCNLHRQIEIVFDEVGNSSQEHISQEIKECTRCGLFKPEHPLNFSKCNKCHSSGIINVVCTNATRLLSLKVWLGEQGLWPFSNHREASCKQLLVKLSPGCLASTNCGLDELCPLLKAKERLSTLLGKAFKDSPSLSLKSYDSKARNERHSEDSL